MTNEELYRPPLGGCVLKHRDCRHYRRLDRPQPPLGGCVLKRVQGVEADDAIAQPPLGGCVLKPDGETITPELTVPAAFRRLCVETFGLCL